MKIQTTPEFQIRLAKFVAGAQEKVNIGMENFKNLPVPFLQVEEGSRYVKIIRGTSVYCFIDKTNGDVLKAASWKAPAKHARGNIFNEDNGVTGVGHHGGNYLRG